MAMRIEDVKIWSEIIGTWVTIIGVFAGGLFALNEYLEKASSERIKVTLEYVDTFNRDPLQSARSHLDDIWFPRTNEIFLKTELGEEELSKFVIDVIKQNNLKHYIDLVVGFFDNISACACAKLCDEQTVRNFFGKYAFDFYGLNFPYIQKRRKQMRDSSYGSSLEAIAKSHKTNKDLSNLTCKGAIPT